MVRAAPVTESSEVKRIRERFEAAVRRDKQKDALEALEELEKLDPTNARWPHRAGDILRRLGASQEAVAAYERAVDHYARDGFIARAIAMAKTILVIDPTRVDVLERADPSAAQSLHQSQRPKKAGAPPPASTASVLLATIEKADADARAKFEVEQREKAERQAAEQRQRAEAARAEAHAALESKIRAELEAKIRAEAEAKIRAEMEVRARIEAEVRAKIEAEQRAKLEAEARAKVEAEGKIRAEAEAKIRAELEAEARARPAAPSAPPGSPPLRPSLLPALPIEIVDDDDDEGVELSFDEAEDLSVDLDLSEIEVAGRSAIDDALKETSPSAAALARLPSFGLFAGADAAALRALANAAQLVDVDDGTTVVYTGEPADALYVIVEGTASVHIPGIAESIPLGEGDVFGEMCLLEHEPRRADVVARGHLLAFRIPRDDLLECVRYHPQVGEILFELLTRRLLGNVLQSSDLFRPFDVETRRALARLFSVRRAPKGTVLITEGEPTPGLYLTLTGAVSIHEGGESTKKRTPAGLAFGQRSLVFGAPSRATVKALVNMIVLFLPAESFMEVATQFPMALVYLTELASEAGDA